MPELPEVETTRRGIQKPLKNQVFSKIHIYQPKLRWPIPNDLNHFLSKQPLLAVKRRAKYLLLETPVGQLIIHLGMSGRLRVLPTYLTPEKHDHADFIFANGACLRYTDPRRFGAILWSDGNTLHPLLQKLGPEPLTVQFSGDSLYQQTRLRKVPIKTFIMDSHVVVGVGNIYASEALFLARIHPQQQSHQLTKLQCEKLVAAIKQILKNAILAGGTTLKDFYSAEGKPGFFSLQLAVYGREKLPCVHCKQAIQKIVLGQRSTFFCGKCQVIKRGAK